jgi:hypothetical protein
MTTPNTIIPAQPDWYLAVFVPPASNAPDNKGRFIYSEIVGWETVCNGNLRHAVPITLEQANFTEEVCAIRTPDGRWVFVETDIYANEIYNDEPFALKHAGFLHRQRIQRQQKDTSK